MMQTFDDNILSRPFGNFQFMNFIEIMNGLLHCCGDIGGNLDDFVVLVQDHVSTNVSLRNQVEMDSKVKLLNIVQVEEISPHKEELTIVFKSLMQQGYTLVVAIGIISSFMDYDLYVVLVGAYFLKPHFGPPPAQVDNLPL